MRFLLVEDIIRIHEQVIARSGSSYRAKPHKPVSPGAPTTGDSIHPLAIGRAIASRTIPQSIRSFPFSRTTPLN